MKITNSERKTAKYKVILQLGGKPVPIHINDDLSINKPFDIHHACAIAEFNQEMNKLISRLSKMCIVHDFYTEHDFTQEEIDNGNLIYAAIVVENRKICKKCNYEEVKHKLTPCEHEPSEACLICADIKGCEKFRNWSDDCENTSL